MNDIANSTTAGPALRGGTTASADEDRGRTAEGPSQIPAKGWRDVLRRVAVEAREDRISLLAAGVAFFLLLSMVPALIAALSVYGLVSDPDQVRQQIEELTSTLPTAAQELLTDQISSVAERSDAGLSISAAVAIVVALWSASAGVRHLIEALNIAYDESEDRGLFARYGQALVLATVGIVGGVVVLGAIAVLPDLLESSPLPSVVTTILIWLRWPLLALLAMGALAVLYKVGPDRDSPRVQWVSWGAVVATVVWLVASALFSVYADRFSSYASYGSLAGVVVLMLWLQISAAAVLLGAELNCELERQTTHDSTVGPSTPMGARDAHAADTVGPPADRVAAP